MALRNHELHARNDDDDDSHMVLPQLHFYLLHGSTSLRHQFKFSVVFCSLSPSYNFAQNVIGSSVGGSDYLPQISSKSVQYLCKARDDVFCAG